MFIIGRSYRQRDRNRARFEALADPDWRALMRALLVSSRPSDDDQGARWLHVLAPLRTQRVANLSEGRLEFGLIREHGRPGRRDLQRRSKLPRRERPEIFRHGRPLEQR